MVFQTGSSDIFKTERNDMIRKKSMKVIAAFPTTTDAMRMQIAANTSGLAGRLIPIPEGIRAGCGLAWCSEREFRSDVEKAVKENQIAVEHWCEMMW